MKCRPNISKHWMTCLLQLEHRDMTSLIICKPLSGFIQLGDQRQPRIFTGTVGRTLLLLRLLFRCSRPSALLYIKQGKAAAESIEFRLNILETYRYQRPPFELNRILGNIINNAFDHVQTLDVDQRWFRWISTRRKGLLLPHRQQRNPEPGNQDPHL